MSMPVLKGYENEPRKELEIVQIAELQVDRSYQRDLNQNLVEKILRDWQMIATDAITVSRRTDGSLWIVNGQHRAAAAALANETEMIAFVYEGLTVAEEAALRLKANNNRQDTAQERFHGQLTSGNEESLAILRLAEEFGSTVNRSPNKHSGINCVSALEMVFRLDGGLTLRQVFALLRDANIRLAGETATEPVLRGLAWFLRQHSHEYERNHLRKRLEVVGINDLLQRARAHQNSLRGSMWVNFYRAVVEVYNYRRSEANRLEWHTSHRKTIDPAGGSGSRN
jgi:Family of unknown function (DUF6551)